MKTEIKLSTDTVEKLKHLFSGIISGEKGKDIFSACITDLLNSAKHAN